MGGGHGGWEVGDIFLDEPEDHPMAAPRRLDLDKVALVQQLCTFYLLGRCRQGYSCRNRHLLVSCYGRYGD